MNQKLRGLLLVSLLLISTMGGMIAIGGSAMAVSNTGPEMFDQTVSIDDSTNDVYLEVNDTSGDALKYEVYGVSDGVTTLVDEGDISDTGGDTTPQRLSYAADSTAYDNYRITVYEDGSDADTESAQSIVAGSTVDQQAGGGGFFGGGGGGGLFSVTNLLIAAVLAGGAYVAGLLDPIEEWITGQ